MPRKRNETLLVGLTDRDINNKIKKIKKFRPLQVRQLLREAKHRAGKKGNVDDAFQQLYDERRGDQFQAVLRSLDVDLCDPDAFAKGFRLLASQIYGVARLAYSLPRQGRNAQMWTSNADRLLIFEVMKRKARGLTEPAAIKEICKDRTLSGELPYRRKIHSGGSKRDREKALAARLQTIKSTADIGRALGVGGGEASGSQIERALSLRDCMALGLHLDSLYPRGALKSARIERTQN